MARRHPRDSTGVSEDRMREFFMAPMDRYYFDEWFSYLAAVFAFEPTEDRREATHMALVGARFTNAKLGIAGDWIVANNERFPVPAHFINCPALRDGEPA